MRVRVRLFAAYREAVGRGDLEVEVPDGQSIRDLWQSLQKQYPKLAAFTHITRFALNRELAEPGARLSPEDEIAFLPPVSGGAHA
ncbi:MAG: MoaD/ThiS family protein [Chloroflexi bacterium]|nr:MoaD/ThiS family protein [Chloroflexota bacterium]